MKKEIKNKQEKGITLIALVVTIVVLLILAGVSISLVLNNNGVISKAKDAKNQYAEAQTNDEKQLNEVSDWIDTKVGDTTGGGSASTVDGVPIPAGQTTAVNNIYDMGGNVWEWTTESYSYTNYPYTCRGGFYNDSFVDIPAGYRIYFSDVANDNGGFRLTLFL